MSALAGHKFIIIGDSYTVGITAGGQTITSWLGWFTQWYGTEWTGYYANPEGGYGFAKTGNQFITLLNGLDNTITNKDEITDILVAGGYNDHAYVSGLSTAIAEFATTARSKYVNATLWIAPIGWTVNQYQNDVSSAIEAYISLGRQNGYRVLEEMKNVMRNTSYISSDEIHPNENGYKALAENMHRYLVSYISSPKISYNGSDRWKIKATELLNQVEETHAFEEEVLTTTTAESVETGTHTTIMSLALSKGTWQINATAIFASNATGYRHAYIAETSSSTSAFNSMMASSNAVDGMVTALNFGRAVELSAAKTIYLRVRHNRGSDLDVYGRLTAVRLNATT